MLKKLVIVGVGLIGGSFAMALRNTNMVERIVGVGRSWENLSSALGTYVIDAAETNAVNAVADADLVVLAVPVGQMGGIMQEIAPVLSSHTVITDVGSTKQDVIELAMRYMPEHLERFVPGHPIAGAERSGVKAATDSLFQDKNVILTPLPETSDDARNLVKELWQKCGAIVHEMPPKVHDQIFAAVSHLPHVLAYALVADIAARPNASDLFQFAAGGFRDFTRIASSSPEMWRDICLANRDAMVVELDSYLAQVNRMRDAIIKGDGIALQQIFDAARNARNAWISGGSK
ncbi:prephenate dehydrogenase [Sulfurirhabdus autotrophica]|uniref:prephenate dehydrogenase n=1 Tax=Sulfurirhabdus autotrophica TaxID=1706046 RepID=A0A4R3YGZ9_9PROT|nr:prephenate dehydrogenase/arogenate dehydrogenase family protein [Sulfurirhabdus autotrophica]TCV90528.1 prephenate dehydrogenase [Sulfurirhabdus autotrophica]